MLEPRLYQSLAVESVFPLKDYSKKLVVIPTGGGKSLISAILAQLISLENRMLIITHVQELVSQTEKELKELDPSLDVGVYCAALDRRDTDKMITIASVQSIYKRLDWWFDVSCIIVDEAHRITPVEGKTYRAVLDSFPDVPLVGLTATPFRDGTGYLHEGEYKLFDEISFEVTYDELVNDGYLVPFAERGSDLAYETDTLHMRGGEFIASELDVLARDTKKTQEICQQFVQRSQGRKYPLIFAINVRHAQIIREIMEFEHGKLCSIMYSGMEKDGLDRKIERESFEQGITDYLLNVAMLTTGYNFRPIDCIGLFCPIGSPVKYIQCVGRGTRTAPGKPDCLLLDYGGNVSRHGHFASPEIKPRDKTKGPVKPCPNVECGEINSIAARYCKVCRTKFQEMFKNCPECEHEVDYSTQVCPKCGYGWPINEEKLDPTGTQILPNRATWLQVEDVSYRTYKKEGSSHTCFVAMYKTVEGGTIQEYVFPEVYSNQPKFAAWWQFHGGRNPVPKKAGACYGRRNELKTPRRIKVIRNKKIYVFLGKDFGNEHTQETRQSAAIA